MKRWTFGEPPLDQTVEAAALLRRVASLVLAAEQSDPAVAQLLADLERAEAALGGAAAADRGPRVGDAADRDGRVYLDHSTDIGTFNPSVPEYELIIEGEGQATGTVSFPIVFEGPPGIVHGGFLALLVDCVVQHHNCEVGVAGKTTSLALRFRRPAPLLTPLSFSIDRRVDGDRIHSAVQLSDPDRLLCEGEVEAIAGDRATLPAVGRRRPAP